MGVNVTIILSMIFCHIIADFNLQGIMGDLKQEAWWKRNYPDQKYLNDYKLVLLLHSFSWAFLVMMPLSIRANFNVDWVFIVALVLNTIIHAIIDDLKANKLKLNLIQDQIFHMIQIIITAVILLFVV